MSDFFNPFLPLEGKKQTVKLTSQYPELLTDRIAETADFYRLHFGFTSQYLNEPERKDPTN